MNTLIKRIVGAAALGAVLCLQGATAQIADTKVVERTVDVAEVRALIDQAITELPGERTDADIKNAIQFVFAQHQLDDELRKSVMDILFQDAVAGDDSAMIKAISALKGETRATPPRLPIQAQNRRGAPRPFLIPPPASSSPSVSDY